MKLARARYTDGGTWFVNKPYSTINQPPVGTIVQYELDVNGVYAVYFPGILGHAPMSGWVFNMYFKDLGNETS